jgi:tetratricopeptide (TPR) repeat protein
MQALLRCVALGLPLACATSSPPPDVPAAPSAAAVSGAASTVDTGAHAGHAASAWTLDGMASGAKLLGHLGEVHRTVSTGDRQAQAYFDQGLALTWGFNHDEAARSFAKAGVLDPSCGLCWWGVAYTLGPNYNMPMLPERAHAAWEALGRAESASSTATPTERALIGALAKRYAGPEYVAPPAMQAYSQAYSAAMKEVAASYPDDDDVQVLYAESIMNLNPWKLWTPDGEAAPGTLDAVRQLETVLARAPEHAGANHYYIHAVEASTEPGRALPAARRLGSLVPGAGHLIHMPAHIFQRVGMYAEASEANRRAIAVDEAYIQALTPLGYYPFYLGHNHGFLAYSASMEGRSQEALSAAQSAAATIPKDIVCGMPGMDFFLSEPLFVQVRFGRWEEILNAPASDPKYPVLGALQQHARGMALAATGHPSQAAEAAAAIRLVARSVPAELMTGLNSGKQVLELAALVVEARAADATHAPNAAELWEQAVKLEDGLAYHEPADWFYPTRHYLGATLLDAGQAKRAEAVYREDLRRNPRNGWALFGVWKALEAQGRAGDAKAARAEFEAAFARADVQLVRSAF